MRIEPRPSRPATSGRSSPVSLVDPPEPVFERPLTPAVAVANVDRLLALLHVQTARQHERFWPAYRLLAAEADARGNLAPDAHLAALMVANGVRTIWTHDRDYRRVTSIETRDPFD